MNTRHCLTHSVLLSANASATSHNVARAELYSLPSAILSAISFFYIYMYIYIYRHYLSRSMLLSANSPATSPERAPLTYIRIFYILTFRATTYAKLEDI